MNYLVVDSEFNRTWYKNLIGLVFMTPPGFANVKVVNDYADYNSISEFLAESSAKFDCPL